jgi:hypothetical protein
MYWLAIGLVGSHLCLAEYWNARTSKRFGDCVNCAAPQKFDPPLADGQKLGDVVAAIKGTLGKSPTAFTHGNGMSAAPNSAWNTLTTQNQAYADAQAKAYQAMLQQAPLVSPGMSLVPTRAQFEAMMPSAWKDYYTTGTYYDPFKGTQSTYTPVSTYTAAVPSYWSPFPFAM